MKPQVYHVDAFTSQPFRGNSAGVVFPADNLSLETIRILHLPNQNAHRKSKQRSADIKTLAH